MRGQVIERQDADHAIRVGDPALGFHAEGVELHHAADTTLRAMRARAS